MAALTHCPYCALNCGLALREDAGTVVGFDRWKDSPLTRGALCSKGVTAWEQMPHADRLRRPLVRRDGRLVETDWETALDLAAGGFARIAGRRGAGANAVLSGGSLTNEVAYLVGKFARVALRTPHVDLNGRMCMTSAGAAYTQAFGIDRAPAPLAELDRADVAVVIGANLSSTFPVVIPTLLARLRRRGGRVIVVDPRAGRFVTGDDCWLALRPGTDAAVANGLLREIARLGAIDDRFCADRTTGLGEALAGADPWTPEAVEETADVPAARLREAAAALAGAERVMYLHARGAEQQVTGVANVRAWINVALARGHVGRPGCGIDMLTGQRNGQGGREHGQRCDQLPSGRSIENADHRRVVAERWGVPEAALPRRGRTYVELLADARAGSVAGMLLLSTNPLVSAPDLDHTAAALDGLDHLVVIDPFISETARMATVVLPGTTFGEIEGTITSLEGRVLRCDQAVPPAAGRSEIDVIRNLANRLGAGKQFRHVLGREVFDELRRVSAGGPVDYAGITWQRLRDDGGVFWPCPTGDHPGTPVLHTERFGHPDGRARFARIDPQPPPEATSAARPLILTTGRVLAHYLSGAQTRRIPAQLAVSPEPVAELHPRTAAACGLVDGQLARVASGRGEVVVAWTANPRLRTDTVFLPYHWPVANRLTAADQLDPTSRIPNFKVTPVRVGPANHPLLPPAEPPAHDLDHEPTARGTA
ncbi:MAG TPA: molybdopterin oxidoreductase family protein [Acidimicrobiales bacterium]|nr:molybdopterin oxidoreductase family protein [Acidimicrobiales bacterium]